ncbi:tandem-95 repeat protein, partial [bacterium]|nr:tandem-95 repeat protein [bacterium]
MRRFYVIFTSAIIFFANSISQATVNVDPMEIETEINSGETEDHEIIISHDGGADLDFTVTTEIISEAVNDDAMRDGPRRDERSDPDNFGYIWRDDAEALVVYDWIDITEIGERLRNVGDDWNSGSLDMGWTFDFYGQEFNSIRVCSNGFASFTSASTSYSPFHLPRRAQPYDLLAVQWLDLNPADGGYIYFYTDAEEEITILSWIDVPRYGAGGGDRQTFQLVLSGNGVIKYQYADDNVPGANSCIGIQNGNGRDGLSIHWGAEDGGPAERAYVIMPSWIQVDPVDGTIPRGEEVNLTITLDATYLIEGDYEADVHILTGDPDTPDVVVEIFMFVDGEPSIEVLWDDDLGCPDMIDWNAGDVFPDLFVGEPYDVEITVRNRGTAVLNIDEIVSDHDYFILDQEDMVLGPREKTMLTVTFQAEETGEVNGSLTLSSDDPEMETVEIDLTGETFDPPIIDVEPTSITRKLDIDETTEANLTIINNGAESKLSFETEVEIISEPNGAPEMMGRRDNIPQAPLRPFYVREVVSIPDDRIQFAVKAKTASIKQMKIWDQYQADLQRIEDQPRRDNQGGMDSYGYLWRDDEEGMVDYEWIDISGTGDRMNNVADDWNSGSLDMGWTFSFYGEEFSSIRICSNGFASFTSASTSYQPFQVPNEAEPYNLLAPQWVDLDPSRGGAIYFYTDADEEMTVISWDNIPGYGGGTRQTFQLIISGDGSIKFQYGDDNNAGRNTSIGIQNGDGTDGLSIHYGSEDAGPDGRAYRIMRSWVRLDPVAAEIDPNDEMDVTVVLDATNLIEGLYEADVNIVSNDIENPRITVNVKLEVGSGPGIDVQPESIDFGDVLIGEAGHQKVTITNISLVDLEIDRIEIDGGGFSHNHTGADNFVLEPEETRCLIVNFNPEDTQNYNSELTIFSDDGEQPEATIQLTGQGITPPPEIYLGYLPDEDPGISFAEHVITENFDGAKDICMVDLDADGDMDMLGAAGVADDIAWWENDGSENFTRRMISGNFDGAVSVCWKDLDRDGDIDILGAAQDADDITWWENDGNQSFTAHTIAGEFDGASSVFTTDVDGDGDIDVLGAAFDADDITWWENDGNESFTEHTIQGDFDGASSVSAIDLDGDGDIDVLGTATEADDITWWENNGDKSFSAHTIQGNFDGACSVYPMDVNDDGDMDIVGAALNANDITWWENNGSESFSAHTIDGDFDGASSVYAIDFDMDDDVDIIGAAQDANKITWWENDGDENFTERPIGTDFYGASSVKGGDLDNHGDNDILGVAQESDAVTWWENSHVFGNDFGEIEKDSTGIWTFIIFNHGAQTLNVSDIQSNNNVFSTDFGGNANIDQGASLEIEVTFTPDDYAVFDGILEVQSNDPDEGTVSVSLTGEGIFVNYPPVVENPISDFELDEDFDPFVIADLDTVFLDVNDEDLTYYAESDHNEVAVEIVSGSQLRIDSSEDNWYGSVEITVNADDGYDGGGGSPRNDSGPIRQLRQIGHRQVDDSMISAFALNTTDIRPVSSAAQSLPVSRGNEWMGESTDFNPGYLARRDDATDMVFNVQINPVNDPPQWDDIPDSAEVNEVEELSFTVEGSDLDGDDVTFDAVSGDLPDGWEFNDNGDGSGTFTWTPSYDDSGEYTATFTVSDAEYDVDEDVIITVNHVNRPPVLTAIGDKEVNENSELAFTLEATDPDGDGYTFSDDGLPDGASLNGADFSWTPDFDQSGTYDVTFIVTDDGAGALTDEETITITVNHTNRNPVLTAIGNKEVNENEELTFTLEASDPDGDGYTFSDNGLPTGASLDGADFSWTPDFDQSGNYDVTFIVTDDGAGALTDEETITITVNHVNRSPVWDNVPESAEGDEAEEISFHVEASDPDSDDLTVDASSDDLPDGWDFTDNGDGTGAFSWTPGYDDAGEYTLTVTVSDAEFDVAEDVAIIVNHVNRTPVWDSVPENVAVNESAGLSFTVRACDPDDDDLAVDASSDDLPGGWNFSDNNDGSGRFSWTPTYNDAGEYTLTVSVSDDEFTVEEDITITVNDVNRSPVWEYVPENVEGNENAALSFTVNSTDPDNDDLTVNASSDDLPDGWNFTDNYDGTGRFVWTPGFDDSGEYTLTVMVSDGEYNVDEAVTITINHVNRQPIWESAPEDQTIDEDQELSFTVEASDPDGDDLTVDASSDDLPDGWDFTDNGDGTASFIWTPSYEDAGEYSLTITVSDARLELESTMTISVNHVNRTPVWDDVPESVTVDERETFELIVIASDPDVDELTLTASSDDLPDGWQFTDYGNNRGSFRWRPTYNDAGEYNVTFSVTDGEFEVDAEVTVTVNNVNRTPIWDDMPQSINIAENELLEFTVQGSDPDNDDLTINYSSEDIPEEADFTDNENGTGTFSWRPAYDEAGAYHALFTLSDGSLIAEAEVIITVGEVNRPPDWDNVPENVEIDETAELTVTVEGSDPDDDTVTIEYSSEDIPEAAEFTDNEDGTGVLTWTPTYDDAGEYTATFTISDEEFSVETSVAITVNHVNRTPVWDDVPEAVSVDENSQLEFSVNASAPDGDNITLDASSEDLPGGWNFTDNGDGTGTFTWTPSYEDEGEYSVALTVSDEDFDNTTDVPITVNHVNRTPVWNNVPDQVSVNENQQLQFSVQGSDPDGDEITINASSEDIPEGWSFTDNDDGTGTFRWTPGFEDSGDYTATFALSDGEYSVEESVTIQVNHVNRQPEWTYVPETEEVNESDELQFTVQAADPDGDNLTIHASSNDLPEGWEFRDNGDRTGTFSWTPGFEDSGEYGLTLTVSDAEFDVAEEVAINVVHVNRTPVWAYIPESVEIDEVEVSEFTVEASDPDGDDLTIQASSDDLPEGWEFTDNNNGTGDFSWTPTYDDAGEYTLTVTVSDDQFDVSEDIVVTVNHVNRTPAWESAPGSVETDENQALEFTVTASDPDNDNLAFNASSENLPDGWEFTDNEDGSGDFSWTPDYDDAGEYSLVLVLSDGEFQLQRTITITVNDVNRAPVWTLIPEIEEVDEAAELIFNVEAEDPDGDDVIIVASSDDLPDTWEFTDNENGTGSFTWTPGYNDSGEYTVTFSVTDFSFNVAQDVTIRANHVNRSPAWENAPESVQTDEMEELAFTVQASDPDGDDLTIEASSDDLPQGWEFTDNGDRTAAFNWTPTYDDAGEYTLLVTASDGDIQIQSSITVTINQVNRTPVWIDIPESVEGDEAHELSFTVEASDPDGDNLTLDASSDDLSNGWEFTDNDDGTGTFNWTPGYDDSGQYTATFTATDGEFSIQADVTITINHVNREPEWVNMPDAVQINENQLLEFTVTASDPDGDNLSINANSDDLPEGWEFNDNDDNTGAFSWMPSYNDAGEYSLVVVVSDGEYQAQSTITITVNNTNRRPVWTDLPGSETVDEADELSFNVEASDPDGDNLTLDASSDDLPEGWEFTDNGDGTGTFNWTCSYDDAGEYTLTVTGTDGELNIEGYVTITVYPVNRSPVWDNVPESVDGYEDESLVINVVSSDPDGDNLVLQATSEDLPDGWTFNYTRAGRGTFSWTPNFNDAGEYNLDITTSDGEYLVEASVSITVNDVNRAPAWINLTKNYEINEAEELSFTATATDPDGDDFTLSASSENLPDGWEFTDNEDGTGVFNWTPGYDDEGTYRFELIVSDAEFDISEEVEIVVGNINRAPFWSDNPESVGLDEAEEFQLVLEAVDPDGDDLTIEASSDDLPEGWDFTDNDDGTGTFDWTPSYDDEGEYTLTVTVSDTEFEITDDIGITVSHVNRTPVWTVIPESREVNETSMLTINVTASDPDDDELELSASSDDLPDGWQFVDHADGRGAFTWRPSYDDAGEYTLLVTASDGDYAVQEDVSITVNHVNRRPVWDNVPQSRNVMENELCEFTVIGHDLDEDDLTVTYSSEDLSGEEINFSDNNDGTADFSWRPGDDDSGSYVVLFTISDYEFDISGEVVISVGDVNRSPIWDEIPENVEVDEAQELSFTVVASDPDDDELTIEANSEDLPDGWEFVDHEDGTGTFAWTPGYDDSGQYTVSLTLSDGEFHRTRSVEITVNHVNRTPVWDEIPESVTVNENELLEFTFRGSDPDNDSLIITYSSDNIPESSDFSDNGDGTGAFSWRPTFDEVGEYNAIFSLSDGNIIVQAEVVINVYDVNRQPVWESRPESVTVNEEQLLEFTVQASDPDGDDISIEASSEDLPGGWNLTDNGDGTADFEWTPGFDDAGEYSLLLTVSDGVDPLQSRTTITVNQVNREPDWVDLTKSYNVNESEELSFTIEASDPDGDNLNLSAFSNDLPEEYEFTDHGDGTADFSWTPTYDDGGDYILEVTVSDAEFEITEEISITVNEINRTPDWTDIPESVDIDEQEFLSFTVEASDPDDDELSISCNSENLPDGWQFRDHGNGSGTFRWTPTYDDAGAYLAVFTVSDGDFEMDEDVTINVNPVNRQPSWDTVPDSVSVNEAEELSFTLEASDPDGDDLTLEASSDNLPEGWEFTDNGDATGTFVWTPGYEDAGEYSVAFTVSDNEFSIVEQVVVTVNHVNRAPSWVEIPEQIDVSEAEELIFAVRGSDPDDDDLTLSASSGDLPEGWEFTDNNDGTGDFNWTPSFDDAGEYTITVTISDGEFDIDEIVVIVVNQKNRAPTWVNLPESVQINEAEELSFTVQASDPDNDELALDASSEDIPEGWEFTDNGDA